MDIGMLREYCLSKIGTSEDLPFGDDTTVFKVGNKIFLLTDSFEIDFVNLKCDPERAIELRDEYPEAIRPGYHMNKKHWNSVYPKLGIELKLVFELIDHSYDLIYQSLPAKIKKEISA